MSDIEKDNLHLETMSVSTSTDQVSEDDGRDEVAEVKNMSSKDTARVRSWRIALAFALLATAVAVTATTYSLLDRNEHSNFENAVSTLLLILRA